MVALAAAVALATIAHANDPNAGERYRVKPGSVVVACGGFLPRCEVQQLRGTLTLGSEHDKPAILASDLEISAGSSAHFPFPSVGDLQLTELVGSGSGSVLRFESPAASPQGVALDIFPFEEDLGNDEHEGLVLDGVYDEGCCDRFTLDFGNIVLRHDSGADALELHGQRFRIGVEWQGFSGQSGIGHPIVLDDQSGYFWFLGPDNPEIFVKILDACSLSETYWVFVSGLTNLGVEISIFDELGDIAIPVTNPKRRRFETFIDTSTFVCQTGG